jgi:tetratricopeptide (TPR) repeat protein
MLTKRVLAAFCLTVLYGTSVFAASTRQATPVRDADAACAKCHAAIFQSYVATPMANASGLAVEKLHSAKFVHAASSAEYTIGERNNQAFLTYRSLKTPDVAGNFRLDYFLGSGHLGTTYLYSIGDFLFESPVAWYGNSVSYDMKPGLATMDHMPPPLPMQSGCLRCHMSSVQASDTGTINRYQGLAFLHTGITCEACHGDSQQHILARGKAKIVNPTKLDPNRRDSICISCHLEGDVSVERTGRSALNYRPGESILDYLSYYVQAGAKLTARGVSEVEQLNRSTCKRVSGDRMSCTSCHDPHYTPDGEHRAAFFRSKCLTCHNQPEFASKHHPENQDCTSCHMGRTGAANIPHVAWTDHRILKQPEESTSVRASNGEDKLVPLFVTESSDRDLAMAYYQLLLEGNRSLEATAWSKLQAQRDAIADDKQALDALGNLAAERGDYKLSEQVFRRVLEIDSDDSTALSNLGILLAKQGKPNDAIPFLKSAFDRNLDIPAFAMNLARVECMTGDGPGAQKTLAEALFYSPYLEDIQRLQTQTKSCDADGK